MKEETPFKIWLDACLKEKQLDLKLYDLLLLFHNSYCVSTPVSPSNDVQEQSFLHLCKEILKQTKSPYSFSVFHQSIRSPFDYYQFGLDFIRPFIDMDHSCLAGETSIKAIEEQIKQKENVVLFANHQTEPDPQVISLLLEKSHQKLASDMIFVAGHRVISDPVAIPMSLGRNLLCIYSKKHITHPPEKKAEKMHHNRRTLKKMQELLNEGGCCIYVAPSGGRDRLNKQGDIEVAPFDPQSIEFFYLMGKQAARKTHFYPLSLHTYHLMPPPIEVEKELGEKRFIHYTPVQVCFGNEIDMENIPNNTAGEEKKMKEIRARIIWETVQKQYLTVQ